MSCEADIVLLCLETAIEAVAESGRLDMVYLLRTLYRDGVGRGGMGGTSSRLKTAGTLAMRNGHYAVAEFLTIINIDKC